MKIISTGHGRGENAQRHAGEGVGREENDRQGSQFSHDDGAYAQSAMWAARHKAVDMAAVSRCALKIAKAVADGKADEAKNCSTTKAP